MGICCLNILCLTAYKIYLNWRSFGLINMFQTNLLMLSTAECDLIRSSVFVEGVQALKNHISVDSTELEDVKRDSLFYLKSGSPATEKKLKELVKPLTRSQTY